MNPLQVEVENRWRANIRGPRAWELCRDAGRRKPPWSSAARAWVVSESTARTVVAMAEHAGLAVVVTGSPAASSADAPAIEATRPELPDPDDGGLLLW